jgi:uncharacterized membrane protein
LADQLVHPGAAFPARPAPVVPPPHPAGLSPVLERNIRSLTERRERERRTAPLQARAADAITRFAGSMVFVYLHLVVFGVWIAINSGLVRLPGIPRWDESFVILGTSASVEAIFLSTFVLISQNRMAALADKRADLDLQVSLLAEHEITKVIALTSAIAERLGIDTTRDTELHEMKQDIAPEAVLDEIEQEERTVAEPP